MPEIGSLFVSLGINSAEFDKKLPAATKQLDRFGAMSGKVRFAVQNLSFQLNDVATSLASGISPMRVLAQQGGQLVQVFQQGGGPSSVLGGLASSLRSMVTPATVAAAGLATLAGGLALLMARSIDSDASIRKFDIVLKGLGNQGTETGKELEEAAKRLRDVGLTAVEAREALIAATRAGINANHAERVVRIGQNLIPILGDDAPGKLVSAITGGVEALGKLGFQLGVVSEAEVEAARKAEILGQEMEHLDRWVLAIEQHADGLNNDSLSPLERAFRDLTLSVSELLDTMAQSTAILTMTNALTGLVDVLRQVNSFTILGDAFSWGKQAGSWLRDLANPPVASATLPPLTEGGFVAERPVGHVAKPTLGKAKKPKRARGKSGPSIVSQWREELQQQLIEERNFFNDSKSDELAFWKSKVELTKAGSKERLEVHRTIFGLEKELARQARDEGIKNTKAAESVNDEVYTRKQANIQQLADLEKITTEESLVRERDLLDQKWQADLQFYDRKHTAAVGDADTQEALYQELLVDYERFLTQREQIDHTSAKTRFADLKDELQEVADALKNSFSNAFDSLIEGTLTLKDAIGDLLKSLGKLLINKALGSLLEGGGGIGGGGLFGSIGSALGFATGGSFEVGGSGGIDSKMVAFRATPGELVNVTKGNQAASGGGGTVRIELNPSESWVAGVADQRIKTSSGQIIKVAVRNSQKTIKRNFGGMAAESQARSM